jgi:hypothetical protein
LVVYRWGQNYNFIIIIMFIINFMRDTYNYTQKSSKLVVICVILLLFVLFCVLFVCKCVLPPGDNPNAVNKIYHIIYLKYCSCSILLLLLLLSSFAVINRVRISK